MFLFLEDDGRWWLPQCGLGCLFCESLPSSSAGAQKRTVSDESWMSKKLIIYCVKRVSSESSHSKSHESLLLYSRTPCVKLSSVILLLYMSPSRMSVSTLWTRVTRHRIRRFRPACHWHGSIFLPLSSEHEGFEIGEEFSTVSNSRTF